MNGFKILIGNKFHKMHIFKWAGMIMRFSVLLGLGMVFCVVPVEVSRFAIKNLLALPEPAYKENVVVIETEYIIGVLESLMEDDKYFHSKDILVILQSLFDSGAKSDTQQQKLNKLSDCMKRAEINDALVKMKIFAQRLPQIYDEKGVGIKYKFHTAKMIEAARLLCSPVYFIKYNGAKALYWTLANYKAHRDLFYDINLAE